LLRDGDDEDERALRQISEIATTIASGVNCGDYVGAMCRFVDYWSGHGSWDGLPNSQRIALATRINKVTLDLWATLNDPTRLDNLADLDVPTLIVSGGRSPFPTRRICFHLARTLPDVKLRTIDEAGHMLPSSHFKEIAPLIRFHCDARNHFKSESDTILQARVCA
jgi:pimeloyl-ACP methyl ester carboxylesterase